MTIEPGKILIEVKEWRKKPVLYITQYLNEDKSIRIAFGIRKAKIILAVTKAIKNFVRMYKNENRNDDYEM